MKTITSFALAVCCALGRLDAQEPSRGERPPIVSFSDVGRFLDAFDHLATARTLNDSADVLWREYYLPATPGLRSFIKLRIGSPFELLEQIRSHAKYYAHLRASLGGLSNHAARVSASLDRFKTLYPAARLAPVYFTIGRMTSGGTISNDQLLIGAEMYGRDATAPANEFNEWERTVLRDTAMVATIVVHELMHVNQPGSNPPTLLGAALREGGADFVAEVVTGRNINAHVHEWGLPREPELWAEFSQVMNEKDRGDWFGAQRRAGRPADLGYFIGYRIAKAYYDRTADKAAAIGEILNADAARVLAQCGYPERFR